MILVRDVFQIKYGRMKEAKSLWKEMMSGPQQDPQRPKPRLLTDLTGQYYTMVVESIFNDLADYESSMRQMMSASRRDAAYEKFIPLVDSGRREIFTIVE